MWFLVWCFLGRTKLQEGWPWRVVAYQLRIPQPSTPSDFKALRNWRRSAPGGSHSFLAFKDLSLMKIPNLSLPYGSWICWVSSCGNRSYAFPSTVILLFSFWWQQATGITVSVRCCAGGVVAPAVLQNCTLLKWAQSQHKVSKYVVIFDCQYIFSLSALPSVTTTPLCYW